MTRAEVLQIITYARKLGRVPDLRGCDLSGCDLRCSNLSWSDLRGSDLRGCNPSGCNLRGCDLSWSDLSWCDLRGCNLSGCNLSGCDLHGTILDPSAVIPPISDKDLDGFKIVGNRVYGWRTATSRHIGSTDYSRPGWYVAPVFSVDATTECHPGIYLATKKWLEGHYPNTSLVPVWAYRHEMIKASDKFRAKRVCRV